MIEAKNSLETTDTYYTILDMDARGHVTQMHKGGVTVSRQYDAATGRPIDLLAEDAGYQTVQELSLSFDVLGNLLSKTDRSRRESGSYKNVTEVDAYDDLNRLDTVTQNGWLAKMRWRSVRSLRLVTSSMATPVEFPSNVFFSTPEKPSSAATHHPTLSAVKATMMAKASGWMINWRRRIGF